MHISSEKVFIDIRSIKLAELIEVTASIARNEGREEDAVSLFRLRVKIREGLSYNDAKKIFDKHTNNLS